MPRISQVYQSKYLTAADLGGQDLSGKIVEVSLENMSQSAKTAEQKVLIKIDTAKKPIVLGKMAANDIAKDLGDDTDEWLGAGVTLAPGRMMVAGQWKEVITVRSAIPA